MLEMLMSGKKNQTYQLSDVETNEVSLVGKGAVPKSRFLIMKKDDGSVLDDIEMLRKQISDSGSYDLEWALAIMSKVTGLVRDLAYAKDALPDQVRFAFEHMMGAVGVESQPIAEPEPESIEKDGQLEADKEAAVTEKFELLINALTERLSALGVAFESEVEKSEKVSGSSSEGGANAEVPVSGDASESVSESSKSPAAEPAESTETSSQPEQSAEPVSEPVAQEPESVKEQETEQAAGKPEDAASEEPKPAKGDGEEVSEVTEEENDIAGLFSQAAEVLEARSSTKERGEFEAALEALTSLDAKFDAAAESLQEALDTVESRFNHATGKE